MISTLLVVALAIVAAVIVIRLLHGGMEHPTNLMQLIQRIEPVNAASFRHLASGNDDDFLRRSLPPPEYRRLRKLRRKTLRCYYRSALQNSSLLLSYADLLVRSDKPELIEFGQQLSPVAIQLRLALLRGMGEMMLCSVMPLNVGVWRRVSDLYEDVGCRLASFCDVHAPDLRHAVAQRFPD